MTKGYYWVLINGVWDIALWNGIVWKLCGDTEDYNTDDFDRIGECVFVPEAN